MPSAADFTQKPLLVPSRGPHFCSTADFGRSPPFPRYIAQTHSLVPASPQTFTLRRLTGALPEAISARTQVLSCSCSNSHRGNKQEESIMGTPSSSSSAQCTTIRLARHWLHALKFDFQASGCLIPGWCQVLVTTTNRQLHFCRNLKLTRARGNLHGKIDPTQIDNSSLEQH